MSDWAFALSSSIFLTPSPRRDRGANRTVKRYAVGKVGRFSHRDIDPGFVHLEGGDPLPETGRIAGSPQSWNRRGAALIRRRLCGGDLLELQIHSDDQFSTRSSGRSPLPPGGKLAQLGTRVTPRSSGVWRPLSAPKFTIPLGFLPLPRRERSEQASSWALPCSRTRLGTAFLPLEGGGWEGMNRTSVPDDVFPIFAA